MAKKKLTKQKKLPEKRQLKGKPHIKPVAVKTATKKQAKQQKSSQKRKIASTPTIKSTEAKVKQSKQKTTPPTQQVAASSAGSTVSSSERWMRSAVADLKPPQLREGALALAQAADESQQQHRDDDAVRLRTRAVELLDAWFAAAPNSPPWTASTYAKQLREGALACDRLASALKDQDDAQALHYRAQGAQFLEQLFTRFSEQPPRFGGLLAKQLREGTLACDRLASALKDQDDAQALHYRAQGAQFLEQLFTRFSEQPPRFGGLLAKQLREGALACDRLASALKEQDDAQAATYHAQGAQFLEQLLTRFPEQPARIGSLLAKQLREGARACDRLASALKKQDDAKAAEYWGQGAQLLKQLLSRFPEQPPWVDGLLAKLLRQGAITYDRDTEPERVKESDISTPDRR